jgi:hypothetical protein
MARWSEVLRKPSENPLIQIARWIQIMRDYAELFLEETERVVPWLISLALVLDERYRSKWWRKFGLAPLDPQEVEEQQHGPTQWPE